MRFSDLLDTMDGLDLGEPGQATTPPRDNVRAVQNTVARGLETDELRLDLLELDLADLLATFGLPEEHGPNGFFHLPARGIHFRLTYWWPGREAGIHEHSAWTVTAVVWNELTIQTYEHALLRDLGRIVPRNTFSARAGAVGHIYEPCIHNPVNTSEHWSVSLHVFNDNDRPTFPLAVAADDALDEPLTAADFAPAVQRRLRTKLAILETMPSSRAAGLVDRIFRAGDPETKRAAARVMTSFDRERGEALFREVAPEVPISIGSHLVHAPRLGELRVQTEGPWARLLLLRGVRQRVLLEADVRAADALLQIAEMRALEVGALPGALSCEDQLALCEALVAMGVVHPAGAHQGARDV